MKIVYANIENSVEKYLKILKIRISADKGREAVINDIHYEILTILRDLNMADITKTLEFFNVSNVLYARVWSDGDLQVVLNVETDEDDYL
jgi:hypothetical protein